MGNGRKIALGIFLGFITSNLVACNNQEFSPNNFNKNNRVVGGYEVAEGSYPAQAAILFKNTDSIYDAQFCGGTFIAPNWVVTAAHCVDGVSKSAIDVGFGLTTLPEYNVPENRADVVEIQIHPNYVHYMDGNDIALLKVAFKKNKSSSYINYAGKNSAELYTPGNTAIALGWGTLGEYSERPQKLNAVGVKIISDQICKSGYDYLVGESMVCAGDMKNGGIDTCQGDSGGPLLVNGVLIGLTSFGDGCARPGKPGVYTEVRNYASYIAYVTGVSGE